MKALFSRYLTRYLKVVCPILFIWIGSIYLFNGFLPILLGILFFLSVLGTLPYLLYQDMKKIQTMMKGFQDINNGSLDPNEFYKALNTIIPESIDEFNVKNSEAVEKFKTSDSEVVDVKYKEIG